MSSRLKPIEKRNSDPIVNYAYARRGWSDERSAQFQAEHWRMHQAHHDVGMKAVEWAKTKLGRQSYTRITSVRYWVWEDGTTWRLFVNNERGISFEVNETCSGDEAWKAWRSFCDKLGFVKAP